MLTMHWIYWLIVNSLFVPYGFMVNCQSLSSSVSDQTNNSKLIVSSSSSSKCQPICLESTINQGKTDSNNKSDNIKESITTIKDKPIEKLIVVGDKVDGLPEPIVQGNGNGPEEKVQIGKSKSESNVQSDSTSTSTDANGQIPWNSSRRSKAPIRPPKLRFGSKPIPTKTRRISYGSMVKPRSVGKDSDLIPLSYKNSSSQVGGHDILEISSSEKRTSRMRIGPDEQYYQLTSGNSYYRHHHHHQHQPNPLDHQSNEQPSRVLRIRNSGITGQQNEEILSPSSGLSPQSSSSSSLSPSRVNNSLLSSSSPSITPNNGDTRSTSRNIPKLLLPKFSRPAMYSLNGFIPKPNLQRLSTTSTSTTVRPTYNYRLNRKESARSYNLDKNNQRKYEVKHRQSLEDSDDLKISGSSNRLSKRKGYLSTSSNKLGTSINQLTSSHSRSKVGRRGEPGKDFPIINTIPKTSFDCKDHIGGSGFYADPETGCQVWHMCQGHRKHSFLCPNGTIFNQKSGVCDWWYNVDCEEPVTLLTVPSESTIRQTRRSGSSSLFESVLMDRKRNFYH